MSGFVYLIGSPNFGWYKIGKSITPTVRVKDLGILLPFKIEIISVWAANNHHLMEKTLHEIYSANRINGEWFEFTKKEILKLTESIPAETQVKDERLSGFSNLEEDYSRTKNKKVVGLKIQKLRGNFTEEEREELKRIAIEKQRLKKQQMAAPNE